MADPIDTRLPAHDWTGRRVHPVGPPTLAERLAPLEAERDEWRARAHAAEDLIADLGALARGEMAGDERVGPASAVATWDAVRAVVARAPPPRLWWVQSDSEEGANCYAAPDAVSALALAAPDFGCEGDDDLDDLTVSPVTEDDVGRLQAEIERLRVAGPEVPRG